MMTQAPAHISGDRLRGALLELGERQRDFVGWARGVRVVWLWGAVLLMIVIADAIWPMGITTRLVLDLLLVLAVPLAMLLSRTSEFDAHRGPLRCARQLETHHTLRDNPLVNGLLLTPMIRQAVDPFSSVLAKRAYVQAEQTIDEVDSQVIISRNNLHRQGGYAAMVMGMWLITLIVAPSLLSMGLGRLLWPVGDLPPFALTRLTLEANELQPQAGDDVQLTAMISGEPASRVDLVELDDDFNEVRRWRMTLTQASQFERVLRAIRKPMVVEAQANGGRSKRLHLNPRPPETTPEATPEFSPQTSIDLQKNESPSDAAREFDGALQSQWPAIEQGLADLRQQSQRIGQMLQILDTLEPGSEAWVEQLEQIDTAMQEFRDNARELAQLLRETMKTASPEDQAELAALAEALERLSMMSLGICPNPGTGLLSGAGVGSGVGGGFGSGAGGGLLGPTGAWLTGARQAQTADFAILNDMMEAMGLATPSPFGSAGPVDVEATSLPGPGSPKVGGFYDEAIGFEGHDEKLNSLEAAMQRVPPRYRPLVQRYFERLADDERNEP